ncbi:MAG: hypothetical protein ACNI27_04575 [Desulfovibrio sp.]
MIVIDGQQHSIPVQGLENLEQIFDKVMEDGHLQGRIVTNVILNDEDFTEIYPHQAEDIAIDEVHSVQIETTGTAEMAFEVSQELSKVLKLMAAGGTQVAEAFRRADDAEALDIYQDLLDVTKDFVAMVSTLRSGFSLNDHESFVSSCDSFSDLFTEMTEVLENEDWILLADLLEFEFLPAVEKWEQVLVILQQDLKNIQ